MARNPLAIVILIFGFIIPGLEITSNALKLYGHAQLNFTSFVLTLASGTAYILATIPIITNEKYLKTSRLIKIAPLIIALMTLATVKFFTFNSDSMYLFLAEIIPSFGKRFLLIYALISGPATALGQTLCPFDEEIVGVKPKKD